MLLRTPLFHWIHDTVRVYMALPVIIPRLTFLLLWIDATNVGSLSILYDSAIAVLLLLPSCFFVVRYYQFRFTFKFTWSCLLLSSCLSDSKLICDSLMGLANVRAYGLIRAHTVNSLMAIDSLSTFFDTPAWSFWFTWWFEFIACFSLLIYDYAFIALVMHNIYMYIYIYIQLPIILVSSIYCPCAYANYPYLQCICISLSPFNSCAYICMCY